MIVDAVGVTKSLKTASRTLITKPSVSLEDLATGVMMGIRDEYTVSSLAGRMARLNKQLDLKDQARIETAAGGVSLTAIVKALVDAIDPDRIEEKAREIAGAGEPGNTERDQARDQLVGAAAQVFTGPLIALIDSIRRDKEQTIDHDNLGTLVRAEWAGDTAENARLLTQNLSSISPSTATRSRRSTSSFSQPARRAEVTYGMILALLERLREDRPKLAPLRVWNA